MFLFLFKNIDLIKKKHPINEAGSGKRELITLHTLHVTPRNLHRFDASNTLSVVDGCQQGVVRQASFLMNTTIKYKT
jgi:hypothetical protein